MKRRGIVNVQYFPNDREGRARALGAASYLLEKSEAAQGRELFAWTDRGEELSVAELKAWLAEEQSQHRYTYTLVISPAPGEADHWSEEEWRAHVGEVMSEIERRHPEATWAAVRHEDPEHPHAHVLLEVDRTLRKPELSAVNGAASRSVERVNEQAWEEEAVNVQIREVEW